MAAMSTLAADVMFDFTFPPCDPTTPPSFSFDPALLQLPFNPGHSRSSSDASVYSAESSPSDTVVSTSTRKTTPSRSPMRTHGPLLLPKIRSQDQAFGDQAAAATAPPAKRARRQPTPTHPQCGSATPSHNRSRSLNSNPETISFTASLFGDHDDLCSSVSFVSTPETSQMPPRRASSCGVVDGVAMEKYGFPTFGPMPTYSVTQPYEADAFPFQPYTLREPSPVTAAVPAVPAVPAIPMTPEPVPSTTLLSYLTAPNPAPSLVQIMSFPLRDQHSKHFWWDVRQTRAWTGFTAAHILSMAGAANLLACPVPADLLPVPHMTQRHPETETALHGMYASHYLTKLNAALALSSQRPLQLGLPAQAIAAPGAGAGHGGGMATDCMFVANVGGEAANAAVLFGGKPTARVVGLVKSFDRFNTGMRAAGNVKRVEYLRGLAHLHHAMRTHGCRYGFILTEIELVVARNGSDAVPHFGYLELATVQLANARAADDVNGARALDDALPVRDDTTSAGLYDGVPLTACLALWGLCMMAGDEPFAGQAHWRAAIGAPAEGTRKKALPRDEWMPQPQLAEKRAAKRARGWVWPEDPVGRKELGNRGVRYGAC